MTRRPAAGSAAGRREGSPQPGASPHGDVLEDRLRERLGRLLRHLHRQIPDRGMVLSASPNPATFSEDKPTDALDEAMPRYGAIFRARLAVASARIPHPATAGDLLDLVEEARQDLVASARREIEVIAARVVHPGLLEDVLVRREAVDRWPWPVHPVRGGAALHLLAARSPSLPAGELIPGGGPGDVAPVDVARWAQERLQGSRYDPAPDLVALAEDGSLWGMEFQWILDDGQVRCPTVGLAALYVAEQAAGAVAPRPMRAPPIDVTRPTVRALTAMGGADPRDLEDGDASRRRTSDPSTPTSMIFHWSDGSETQLELPFDDGGAAGPLLAVARRYGPAAVRDLLALYAFAWARGARPGVWWWWPDEHLELAGLSDTRDNRKALLDRLTDLSRTRLEVHYSHGRPLVGPMVSILLTDGTARTLTACKLALHDGIYQGVRQPNGAPGNYWWPIPTQLLQMPADKTTGRVHALAPVVGQLWRVRLHEGDVTAAEISARRLADYLAVRGRDGDRSRDTRAAETLRRTLDAGRECGLLADWKIKHGEMETLTAVLQLDPGPEALEILRTGNHPWPALVPATGEELRSWLQRAGLTIREAGSLLDIPWSTLARAARYGERPLPSDVRASLRHYLWRERRE